MSWVLRALVIVVVLFAVVGLIEAIWTGIRAIGREDGE